MSTVGRMVLQVEAEHFHSVHKKREKKKKKKVDRRSNNSCLSGHLLSSFLPTITCNFLVSCFSSAMRAMVKYGSGTSVCMLSTWREKKRRKHTRKKKKTQLYPLAQGPRRVKVLGDKGRIGLAHRNRRSGKKPRRALHQTKKTKKNEKNAQSKFIFSSTPIPCRRAPPLLPRPARLGSNRKFQTIFFARSDRPTSRPTP